MSFTYTNDPTDSQRDAVRFLINDKTETNHSLSDEEIQYLLNSENSVLHAAAAAADAVAAKFTESGTSKQVGDLRVEYGGQSSSIADEYTNLARRLRRRAAVGASPFAGGLSVSGKQAAEQDTDRVQPSFERGMHDHEGTDSSQTSARGVMDW